MDSKKNRVDDRFRKGLDDLEISPTSTGRSDFLKNAETELKKRSGTSFMLPGLAIILGITLIGGAYLLLKPAYKPQGHKNPVSSKLSQKIPGNTSTALITKPEIHSTTAKNNIVSTHIQVPGVKSRVQSPKSKVQNFESTNPTPNPSSLIPNPTSQNPTPNPASRIPDPQSQNPEPNTQNPEPSIPDPVSQVANLTSPIKDSISPIPNPESLIPNPASQIPNPASRQEKLWNIRAGIYYMPEWIFNSLDKDKFLNNFGAEGIFRFGPYSIRTGVGLSITKAYNEMIVETNPYLGSYHALDSMTYHWDSRHYYLIPTVYTTLKDVFDTALQYRYFSHEMQYTYLQVPLILGYDFWEKKRFSLGVRVGAVMSVLL